jgi:integrase/recombinase XerD
MARYGKKAGIQVRCSPHTLRHTFAVNFVRAGGEAFMLQRLLGHSDLAMTRRYCELASGDAFEQGRLYNPVETFGLGDAPAARIPRKW